MKRRAEVAAALGEVWSRWKNDYRFVPSDRIGAAFRKRDLYRKIRGDAFKENARIALEQSLELVGIGDLREHLLDALGRRLDESTTERSP